jgi:pimeloyl-ACP methyl ester carboxylesterase
MSGVQHRSIKVNGYKTSYLDAGPQDGMPVVLLHDGAWGGSNLVSWGNVLGHLDAGYRILAPDLLGFGGSSKAIAFDSSPYGFRIDHLLSLLDLLGLERPVHLVGTSFGGSVALNALAGHSHRVASVMSIAGTGGPWRSAFGREVLGNWDGTKSGIRDILAVLAEPSAEFDLEQQVSDRYATASLPGHYRAMTAPGVKLPPSLKSDNSPAILWPQQLQGINVPVTLVHGNRDALVEPEWTQHLESVLPDCTVIVHDGLHSPNLYQPTYIASLINQCVGSSETQVREREDSVA